MGVEKIDHDLDLRGKVCPYPTLEPRLALNEMAVGEVLEVVTDYYPARQTIPQLMRELDIRMNWLMGIRLFSDFLFGKVRDMERRVRLEEF